MPKVIVTKICFTRFSPGLFKELLVSTLNSSSWLLPCTVKYISQDCHRFDFSSSGLVFKNTSSLKKFKFTNQIWKLSHIKLVGKGIQGTLIILSVSSPCYLQIEWYEKRNEILKYFKAWKFRTSFRRPFTTSISHWSFTTSFTRWKISINRKLSG